MRLTSVSSEAAWGHSQLTQFLQEPKPESIRPYPVLQQTLLELKKKWREKVSYAWICNQFKSLRQDLTVRTVPCVSLSYSKLNRAQVQRIKNQFTVEVYEIHARMALESVRVKIR